MSIRYGLLALIQRQPTYGYQLRTAFEASTGGPLNVGQVYTTLARLERDGCVQSVTATVPTQASMKAQADGTDGGELQRTYVITSKGEQDLRDWFDSPVSRSHRPRDELAIKLAMAIVAPGLNVGAVIQTQRTDTQRALQEYLGQKTEAKESDLPWMLVLDSLIFSAEAELRWLDHCEVRLLRSRWVPVVPPPPGPTS